jgi:biopolymer transport protein ExbB
MLSAQKVYLDYRSNIDKEQYTDYNNKLIFNVIKSLYSFKSKNKETQLQLLNEKILEIKPKINKNLMTISVLTAIAPLLGLLGTVFGIVTTFDIIAAIGTANARSLASGISEALITTKTGLIIAIPGYFCSNRLNKTAERIMNELYSLNHLIHEVKV